MEAEKTPEQASANTGADTTVLAPPDQAAPPADPTPSAQPEAAKADPPLAEPPKPGEEAGKPAVQSKGATDVPVGFIVVGIVVLGVLLLLAFIAYSQK